MFRIDFKDLTDRVRLSPELAAYCRANPVEVPAWVNLATGLCLLARASGDYPQLAESLLLTDRVKETINPAPGHVLTDLIAVWAATPNEGISPAHLSELDQLAAAHYPGLALSLDGLSEREVEFLFWKALAPAIVVAAPRFTRGNFLTDEQRKHNQLVKELCTGLIRRGLHPRKDVKTWSGMSYTALADWARIQQQ